MTRWPTSKGRPTTRPWLATTLTFSLAAAGCTPKPHDRAGEGARARSAASAEADTEADTASATPASAAIPGSTASDATPDSANPPAGIRYRFALDGRGKRLQAEVCFDGAVPKRLVPPMGKAKPFLLTARYRGQPLGVKDGQVELGALRPGDCLDYAVDVDRLLSRKSTWEAVGRLGDDLLLSPDWWLWAPEPRPPSHRIRARFDGPLQASLPWPRTGADPYPYTIPESTFIWKAQGAFGRFERRLLKVGGAELTVTVMGDGFGERSDAVQAWLRRSAQAASDLLGGFPVERAQLLLLPEPGRRSSFGYALRGGGPSTALLLPERPRQELLDDDWTAVHELLHFSLPPLPTMDAWLYEGLVTYFTAVARARAEIISEEEAWWELLDGFERGSKVGTGVTLRKESERMHENRTYWRVYWAGAALALQMDVELHERGTSLAAVVSRFAASRPDDSYDWNADAVIAHLVKLCGSASPARIVARHLDEKDFPDTDDLTESLGVKLAGKTVRYDDEAPRAAARKAIMRARR